MNKRVLMGLSAAVVLLGGVALWLLLAQPGAGGGADLVVTAHETVEDVRFVEIQNAHGTFQITARDGGWQVHDIPPAMVDYERFVHMMKTCAALSAVGQVDSEDLAAYGLDIPQATVLVEYTSGAPMQLSIGAVEPVSGDCYFTAEGKTGLYLMRGELAADFLLPAKGFIERRATPPLAISSPLTAVLDVTFTGGDLEAPITLRSAAAGDDELKARALSFGAVTHLARMSDDYFEMDQTYGIEVLGSLLGIPAVDIEAYNCTPAQMAEYGFDEPWMTVEFGLQNGADRDVEQYRLRVARAADGRWLLDVNDRGAVYVIGEAAFLHPDAGRLMMRWYLSPMLMDVAGVTVTTGDSVLGFAIGGEGNQIEVSLDGQPVDAATFRQFYKLLVSAAHDGEAVEPPAADTTPLAAIQYRYRKAGKEPDTLSLYAGGTRRLAVAVNGNPVDFGMREAYLTRLVEACNALQSGGSFDINW